ncbi:MAG TPA: hypothetical protein VN923_04675 [Thermoanaerobaculia bacterium]|nr:hypothetical protein [Thermoanaerobaculia bacterium]
MRAKPWVLVFVVLIVAAAALAARPPAPHYVMEIRRTPVGGLDTMGNKTTQEGISLKCVSGCNWMTLWAGWGTSEQPTYLLLDERGVRVMPQPPAAPASSSESTGQPRRR